MGEVIIGPGDAISRLLQLHASRANVRLKWSGVGIQDLDLLLQDYSNKQLLTECLWNGLKELMAMPELRDLPEAVQAKIMSIILKAQAVFELKLDERQQKLKKAPFTPGPGAPA